MRTSGSTSERSELERRSAVTAARKGERFARVILVRQPIKNPALAAGFFVGWMSRDEKLVLLQSEKDGYYCHGNTRKNVFHGIYSSVCFRGY
jgi:hypothetical protein